MEGLERALGANRAEVERELANAEAELASLLSREQRLQDTIRRARLFLGVEPKDRMGDLRWDGPNAGALPLHGAMAQVLRTNGNRPMSARELADVVNERALYRMRDGSPVAIGQIHARVHNYDRLFERAGGGIRLRQRSKVVVDPDVARRFDAAMLEVYDAAMRQVGYSARRFLTMVRGRGGLEAARQLLSKPGVSEGFRRLAEARKLHLSMEYQVLRPEFAPLFSDAERDKARERLLGNGLREADLPA